MRVASRYLRPAVEPGGSGVRRALSRSLLLAVTLGVGACSNVPVHRTLPPMNLGEPAFSHPRSSRAGAIVGGNRLTILLNGEQIDGGQMYPATLAQSQA